MSKEPTLAELAALAAEHEDQTETTAGGFDFELPVEGPTVGRLIEYVELGKQPQKPFEGKDKPPAEMVRIVFELLSPKKNFHEYEDTDGNKKTRTDKITIMISKKLGEKASFKALFDKLRYNRENIKHTAQMLNDAFVLTVVHNKSKDGKSTYANVNKGTEWLISPPFKVDAISGDKQNYSVPAATAPIKLFLFDHPTKATWDSLFIDGTNTIEKDGTKEEVSKNWLQERIMSATNYEGSVLHLMLNELVETDLSVGAELDDEIPFEGSTEKTVNVETKKSTSSEDALAELGLV